jgi:hypothetical protein
MTVGARDEHLLLMLGDNLSNQSLAFALSLLSAIGLRFSEVVGAPVDDLQWIEYSADGVDKQLPMEIAQQTFGHASLGTSAAYATTENKLSDGTLFAQTNKVAWRSQ